MLTDDEARALEGEARAFYLRVLLLQHHTACSFEMAYQACTQADQEQR